MAFYNHLIRQPQIHMLDQLLVLDEAWRVVESPFLTPLMREGRAFGVGANVVRGLTPLSCVMSSTQYNPFVRVAITPYSRRRMAVETT